MAKTIENLFVYIAIYISLFPIALFFLNLRQLWPKPIPRTIIIYAIVEFIVNVIALDAKMNVTIAMYSIFTLVEYTLFAFLFYSLLKRRLYKTGVIVFSACFAAFWLAYKFFGEYQVLDSIAIGVESIIVMIFIFCFFLQEMDNVSDTFLYNRYSFWIASGILIYLAGSFFLYVLANQVDSATRHAYWTFANMCSTVKHICFAISFLILTRRKSSFSALRQPNTSFN